MFTKTSQKRVQFQRSLTSLVTGVFAIAAILYGGFVVSPEKAIAASASTVNFQARLQTAAGAIVPDGYYNVEFKLYAADTGGTAVWNEAYYDTNGATAGNDYRVRVVNGYLSVALGSQTAFPATINWDQELWLTMNIGGTAQSTAPTYDGEMNPRLKLTATPFALSAGQLQTTNGANTSKLSLQSPTGGNQSFVIQDQGAAGTYNILTNKSGVQLQGVSPGTVQTGSYNISGTGIAGILQAATFDTATAGALGIGSTNATSILLNQNVTVAADKTLSMSGAAATTVLFGTQVTGDTTQRFTVSADGTLRWGGGGAGGVDVALGRATGGALSTSQNLSVGTTSVFNSKLSVQAGAATAQAIVARGAASQSVNILEIRSSSDRVQAAFGSGGNQLTLGRISGDATSSAGSIKLGDGSVTNSYGVTLQSSTLSANRTLNLPDADGTLAVTTDSTNFIRNQTTQQSGNINVISAASGNVAAVIQGVTGQSVDILQIKSSGGVNSLRVSNNGTVSSTVAINTAVGFTVNGATSQSGDLFRLQDSSANVHASFNAVGNQLSLGRAAASGTVSQGKIVFADGTTDNFGLTLQSNTLSASRTLNLPDESGTILTDQSGVKLQAATPGTAQTGNLNISGFGIFGTGIQAAGPSRINTYGTGTFSDVQLYVSTNGNDNRGIVIQTGAAANANAFQIVDASGNVLGGITGGGRGFFGRQTAITGASLSATPNTTTANAFAIQGLSSQTGNLVQLTDSGGNVNATFNAMGNQLSLGRIAGSGTVTQGKILLADGTTSNFGLTLQTNTLTANRTLTLPDETGTVLTDQSGIKLQTSTPGTAQTGHFRISGTGIAAALQAASLDVSAAGTLSIGTATSTGITIGSSTAPVTLNGNLISNGSQLNTAQALSNFATGGAIGTAAATVDIKTSFTINQTTAGQSLTIPSPTVTTAGRVIYVLNIGSVAFNLIGSPLSTGAAATLVWNGSAWVFSGADANSILNQNASAQTGNFRINGTGIAGVLQAATFDTSAAGALSIASTNATSLLVGSSSVTSIGLTATSTVTIATNASNKTINIGAVGTTNNTTAINIGNTTSTGGASTIQIGGIGAANGSNSGTSVTLQGGQTIQTISNNGVKILTTDVSNTQSAFQVQNSNAETLFGVDTYGDRVNIDVDSKNTGTTSYGLFFGGLYSGEGIASKRDTGGNQYGLDFYTGSAVAMQLGNNGSANFKNATNSSNAFRIQNAGSISLLNVDTTTNTITIGSAGNTATFASTGELTLAGTARHSKSIVLTPEYAGAVLDATNDTACSSAYNGTMTSGYQSGISGFGNATQNYYKWTSPQATTQCYDVVVQIPVPSDWAAWTGSPLTMNGYVTSTANSGLKATVYDSGGFLDTNWNVRNVTPASASTWTTSSSAGFTGSNYTAGGYMTVIVRMESKSNADTRLGNITLNYYSKY